MINQKHKYKKSHFKDERFSIVRDFILANIHAGFTRDRGLTLTRTLKSTGIDAIVACIEDKQTNYYLVDIGNNQKIFSITSDKVVSSFISPDEFRGQFGKKHFIPLEVSMQNIVALCNSEGITFSPNPVLIIAQFERTGSSWLMEWLDGFGKGQAEPLRQHIGHESKLSGLSQIAEGADAYHFHPELRNWGFSQIWLSNFLASQYQPEQQFTKETNLFFLLGFYLDLFPSSSKIIYLRRDIRGIISSCKRNNLYEEWDYSERYSQLKTAVEAKGEDNKYAGLLSKIYESNYIDVLLGLYLINLVEIYKQLFSSGLHVNVLIVDYEDMIRDKYAQIDRLEKFLGATLSKRQESEISSPTPDTDLFNTKKKKINPFDWTDILTEPEELYIRNKVRELVEVIGKELGKHVVEFLSNEIFVDGAPNFAQGDTKAEAKNKSSLEFVQARLTQQEVIDVTQYANIESGLVISEPDGRRQLIRKTEYVPQFQFGLKLVTNIEFASFINWLHQQGFTNSMQGHYIYYNYNMPPSRGGRITFQDGNYVVQKGYELHPVNWVNWIGARAYAAWTGARLPHEAEWDRVAVLSSPQLTNYLHKHGDTTPIHEYQPNNLGVLDMFGNVRCWTMDWYYPNRVMSETGISKTIKGLAWNSYHSDYLKRSYKPIFFGARNTGIRLVKDRLLGKIELAKRHIRLRDLLLGRIIQTEFIFSINKELSRVFD